MSHFYPISGNQCIYEVLCKDGITVRDPDARDAKKNNWGVGVTTVLAIPEKYHLKNWIIDQHLKAAKVILEEHTEYTGREDLFINEVKKVAKILQATTAEKGKRIHKLLENIYGGDPKINTTEQETLLNEFCAPVCESIYKKFLRESTAFVSEQTFYHSSGFGGTVDLHSKDLGIILDFKTKDKGKDDWDKVSLYDEHYMQLEAYRLGLQMPETTRMFIVFISQITPGLHEIRELTVNRDGDFDRTKCQRAGRMFEKLLHYWQHAHDMPIKDQELYP